MKIQNALRKDDKLTAAKLAIKMLVEDEYIIDTAIMVRSLNCVVEHFHGSYVLMFVLVLMCLHLHVELCHCAEQVLRSARTPNAGTQSGAWSQARNQKRECGFHASSQERYLLFGLQWEYGWGKNEQVSACCPGRRI